MESDYSEFNLDESLARIDDILKSEDKNYADQTSIPARASLTFNNGFYVSCSALFVDMRGSKALSEKYNHPTLARISQSYISELVAIMRDNKKIAEISIEGDCVWGVFDTPLKVDIDAVFSTAAQAASMIDILNIHYKRKGYPQITVGIGMAYGETLMIKAGQKSSGVNEVAWLGKLVGEAAQLCSFGNRTYTDKRLMISSVFQQNLNDKNKAMLSYNQARGCYHANVINTELDKWVSANK